MVEVLQDEKRQIGIKVIRFGKHYFMHETKRSTELVFYLCSSSFPCTQSNFK